MKTKKFFLFSILLVFLIFLGISYERNDQPELYLDNNDSLLSFFKEKYPQYANNFKFNIDRKNSKKVYLELTQPQTNLKKDYEKDFDNIVKDFILVVNYNKSRLSNVSALSMVMGYGIYFEEPNFSIILGTNIIQKLPKDYTKDPDFFKNLKKVCRKTDPAGKLDDYCFVGKKYEKQKVRRINRKF